MFRYELTYTATLKGDAGRDGFRALLWGKLGDKYTHTHTRARTTAHSQTHSHKHTVTNTQSQTHTHTRTLSNTHSQTRKHKHTHKHKQNIINATTNKPKTPTLRTQKQIKKYEVYFAQKSKADKITNN